MMDQSVNNVLTALYQESAVIKTYVDTIISGKPVPYTILAKSTDMERNEQIVNEIRRIFSDDFDTSKPEECVKICRHMADLIDIEDNFIMLQDEYEVVMFHGDAVVDGSRQVVTGDRINALRNYADYKGYKFSARKIE